jgi:hypothetical protein
MADYVLHLRSLKSDTPEAIRVRRLLKRLLRDLSLRCVSIRETGTACNRDLSMADEGDQIGLLEPNKT